MNLTFEQKSLLEALIADVIRKDCYCAPATESRFRCGRCLLVLRCHAHFYDQYSNALNSVNGVRPA